MKTFFSLAMLAVLLSGCGNKHEEIAPAKSTTAEEIDRRMELFAASNNARAIADAPKKGALNGALGLTVDVQDAFMGDGKPVVVEVVFPDVRRDESGRFILEGDVTVHAHMMRVRVEALISTNMIPKIRAARAELGGLWVVMNVESVQSRQIENENQEFVLRGKATTIESRTAREWVERITVPNNKK